MAMTPELSRLLAKAMQSPAFARVHPKPKDRRAFVASVEKFEKIADVPHALLERIKAWAVSTDVSR